LDVWHNSHVGGNTTSSEKPEWCAEVVKVTELEFFIFSYLCTCCICILLFSLLIQVDKTQSIDKREYANQEPNQKRITET
jgi:hypothetical protein